MRSASLAFPHRRWSVAALATALGTVTAALLPVPAVADPVLDANCPEPTDAFLGLDANERRAQTFAAQHTGSLVRGEVLVNKASGSGDFVMQLVGADPFGNPTDTVLASTSIADSSVPATSTANPVRIAGTFGAPAGVVAGQGYALVISRPGASAFVHERGGDVCPGREFESDAGGPWTPVSAGYDAIFAVFVTPPPPSVSCKGKQATIVGTGRPDRLRGSPATDVIAALGGNDDVSGLAGNDLICGGRGADLLRGGSGNDFLGGQKGNDTLLGQKGNDKLSGKQGKDTLKGGAGKDKLKGGAGKDKQVQ